MANIETTQQLLDRVRNGENEAREELIARFLPALRGWARGRLPSHSRGLVETDDLVQDALLRALSRVDSFEPERPGSFLSYLHQVLINRLRDAILREDRRRRREQIAAGDMLGREELLERSLGVDRVRAYESALARLEASQQQAVILRVEFGLRYAEIAQVLGRSSANAVRMQVVRALARMAELMRAVQTDGSSPAVEPDASPDSDLAR
jgi:RNA polymerase sigma-70 factor (ECF subfamily)